MPTMAPPDINLDAMRAAILAAVEPEPEPRIARRATITEAKAHFDAGGDVTVSEYGHQPTVKVGPSSTVHNFRTTTWKELREQVAMWRNRYPNQRYYIVPDGTGGATAESEPAEQTKAERVEETHPTLTAAIWHALYRLYEGESKTATERRKTIWDAICYELGEVEAYGLDLGGRVPIGEPIELGNAYIEVDGYGDAVRIVVTDGGMPLWDRP